MNNFTNITAIIQARVGSTRLPNKIFKELCGKPVLWHVVNRVSKSKIINQIIVATTSLKDDDATEKFCNENNILCYRGNSVDVLSRYYEAAKRYNADLVLRITSDCPLIDPVIIDNMLAEFLSSFEKEKIDYMSNSIIRTFPRGLDTEIFPFNILEQTYREATKDYEREHVTPYIYQHPEKFKIKNYANDVDYSFHRWTLDTAEDYELIKKIYETLYNKREIFLFNDILKLFEEKPELIKINQGVKQKELRE